MIDTGQALIEQADDPGQWAALFWVNSMRVPRGEDHNPSFYTWCVDHFGSPFHSFNPDHANGRWSIIQGMQTTYVHFKDEEDAMLFKLRWYGTDLRG